MPTVVHDGVAVTAFTEATLFWSVASLAPAATWTPKIFVVAEPVPPK